MAASVCSAVGDVFCPDDAPSPLFTIFSCVINLIGFIWTLVFVI